MRTRAALLTAAVELVREGQPPSMPEAAARALVSPATAYRYFATAEELWEEASMEAVEFLERAGELERALAAAGDDPFARLEAVVTSVGWRMIDEPIPFRRMARSGLNRWFAQEEAGSTAEGMPVREGRRNRWNARILEPLRDRLSEEEMERAMGALGVAWGPEAVISLIDVCRLDADTAKATMLQTTRWILEGIARDATIDEAEPARTRRRS
jgi:AcrR family transcriptional regulator